MKKHIITFLKEIIPIVVGILVALFINNWNEEQKESKYLNQILATIKIELRQTKGDINTMVEQQNMLIDTLNFYLNDDKVSLMDIVVKVNGINIPPIRLNSWKAISNSRIELLDHEDISALASIEEQKAILKEKESYLMNFFYSNMESRTKSTKAICKVLLFDIVSTEKTIGAFIDRVSGISQD